MKELINNFISKYCTEVYDMPISALELIMDNHKCIEWNEIEYFIPDTINGDEDEDLIHKFLTECYAI